MKALNFAFFASYLLCHVSAFAQVYTYTWSGAVSGGISISCNPQNGSGGFYTQATSLAETFTYNVGSQTMTEAGTITFSPATEATGIGASAEGEPSGSATLSVGTDGAVSFSSTQPVTDYGGYAFGSDITIPVSGYGTFGGQSFSGSWTIEMPLLAYVNSLSPTALNFNQTTASGGSYEAAPESDTGIFVDGTELYSGTQDGTMGVNWDRQNITAIAAVPEPGTFTLFGLGLSTSAFWLRKPKAARLI